MEERCLEEWSTLKKHKVFTVTHVLRILNRGNLFIFIKLENTIIVTIVPVTKKTEISKLIFTRI